jgi:hypothetical protein
MEELESLYIASGNVKWYHSHGKQSGGFPKIENRTTKVPAITVLGIYPKELKSASQRDICTPLTIASLFTKVNGRNNLNVY